MMFDKVRVNKEQICPSGHIWKIITNDQVEVALSLFSCIEWKTRQGWCQALPWTWKTDWSGTLKPQVSRNLTSTELFLTVDVKGELSFLTENKRLKSSINLLYSLSLYKPFLKQSSSWIEESEITFNALSLGVFGVPKKRSFVVIFLISERNMLLASATCQSPSNVKSSKADCKKTPFCYLCACPWNLLTQGK